MGNLGIQNIEDSGLVPTEYAEEIVKEVKGESILLTYGTKRQMSTSDLSQPVLEESPDAYFLESNGLVPPSTAKWKNAGLKAGTLIVYVPIQKSLLEDSSYDIYSDIVEEGSKKLGLAFDNAGLFGVGKPLTWSESVYELATKVGNSVAVDKNKDLTVAIPELATKIGTQGFKINGFIVPNGTDWYLRGLRDSKGAPLYSPNVQEKDSGLLYGFPIPDLSSSCFEKKKVKTIMVDWRKVRVGVRRDLRIEKLDQAVISDEEGKVIYNLSQADAVAFKLTMRVGFSIANPVTELQKDASKRAPVGIITGDASTQPVTLS